VKKAFLHPDRKEYVEVAYVKDIQKSFLRSQKTAKQIDDGVVKAGGYCLLRNQPGHNIGRMVLPKNVDIEVVAHECSHVATHFVRTVIIKSPSYPKLDNQDEAWGFVDEEIAYAQGYLVSQMWKGGKNG
jgi:hypothetical protein